MVPSTIEMERARALEFFERPRTNGWKQIRGGAAPLPTTRPNFKDIFEESILGPVWRAAWAEQDELFYLETMQRILETLRSGSRHQSWSRLSVELGKTYNRIEARLNAPDSFRFSLSGMALGNWPRAFENVVRLET